MVCLSFFLFNKSLLIVLSVLVHVKPGPSDDGCSVYFQSAQKIDINILKAQPSLPASTSKHMCTTADIYCV